MRRGRPLVAALLVLLGGCGVLPARQAVPDAGSLPAVAGPAIQLLSPRAALLRPVQESGSRRLWQSEDGVALLTDGRRVLETAGLGQMLTATTLDGPDPLRDPLALAGGPARLRRVVDLAGPDRDPAGARFGLALDCAFIAREAEGGLAVEERCAGAGLSFTNRHLTDEEGRVVRSEQWVGDSVRPVVLLFRE